MLNSHLIEYMGAIHRQQRSGVLTVIGPGYRLRFCFEGGDPVALDLGAEKELIIADELVVQHKIDADSHRSLVERHAAGEGSIADLVRDSKLASEEEIAAATRGTVESSLLRCFGTMHYEASFDENLQVDNFDFATSAVRLRIATPQLLATVQPRVVEFERITAAVVPNAVFGLDENTHGNAQLSDIDKQILDWVDGRRTVDEIAIGIRDSTFNLSRVLLALTEKKVIRQVHVAVAQVAPALPPPARRSITENLPVYQAPAPASSRIGVRIAVMVGLIVILIVVYGLNQNRQATESHNQNLATLKASITTRAWNEAVEQVEALQKAAGNDVAAIEAARRLFQYLSVELQRERMEIALLIDQGGYSKARERIARLPQDADTLALDRRCKQAADEAQERSAQQKDHLDRALQGGRVAEALQEFHKADAGDQVELGRLINNWREEQISRASRANVTYGERNLVLKQLAIAEPQPEQRNRIERIRAEVEQERVRLTALLATLTQRNEVGAWSEVSDIWNRDRLGEHLHGSDLATSGDRLRQDNEKVRLELTTVQTRMQALIRDGDDPQALRAAAQQVAEALARRPQASNAESLRNLARVLTEIAGSIREDSASDEVKVLFAWLAEHSSAQDEVEVVRARITRLEDMERMASDALERARAFARQDSLEQARRVLEDLCSRTEWRKTKGFAAAIIEFNAVKSLHAQRLVWRQDLERAFEKGDSDQALAIARKMGLKYLPLRIETVPAGAEVLRDGQRLGLTPITIDLPAADRAGTRFELRRAGFVTQQVEATSAEAGWRLRRHLERVALSRLELNLSLSMRPRFAEGRIWTGNRQTLVALPTTATGQVERWMLDAGSADLSQPLYAQAHIADGSVWLPTREGLALRVALDTARNNGRVPLTSWTDHALAVHDSSFVVGRRFLIAASRDGVLRAVDVDDPATVWSGPAGAPFVTGPWRVGDDQVAVLRQDGRLERYRPDDGALIGSDELRAHVTGAWIDATGLHAYAGGWLWRWDGTALTREALPAPVASGGPGTFVAGDGHVFLQNGQDWKDVGRLEGKPTAVPIAWAGHAVLPVGQRLVVIGPIPFVAELPADILDPQVVGDQLVVPAANGLVLTYRP